MQINSHAKAVVIISCISLVLLIAGYFIITSNSSKSQKMSMSEALSIDESEIPTPENVKTPEIPVKKKSNYLEYSNNGVEQELKSGKKVVLFFHANWCPYCRIDNKELSDKSSRIPDNIVVFKIDYDSSSDLKKQYSVTYQHTYVQIDKLGNLITKWNGTNDIFNELASNVK